MVNDAVLQRVDALRATADRLIAQAQRSDATGYVFTPGQAYAGWRAQSLAGINAIVGSEHIYYREFEKEVSSSTRERVQKGLGILSALREDIANGYLSSYRDLVTGEVFTGILDSASYLLENKYKDAAASITGAVLENGLRDVLTKNGGKVSNKGNLQSLSQQCFDKKLVSALAFKNLQAWIALRDHADHGEFGEYDSADVKRMIDGVTDFLSRHLG